MTEYEYKIPLVKLALGPNLIERTNVKHLSEIFWDTTSSRVHELMEDPELDNNSNISWQNWSAMILAPYFVLILSASRSSSS